MLIICQGFFVWLVGLGTPTISQDPIQFVVGRFLLYTENK